MECLQKKHFLHIVDWFICIWHSTTYIFLVFGCVIMNATCMKIACAVRHKRWYLQIIVLLWKLNWNNARITANISNHKNQCVNLTFQPRSENSSIPWQRINKKWTFELCHTHTCTQNDLCIRKMKWFVIFYRKLRNKLFSAHTPNRKSLRDQAMLLNDFEVI